MKKNFAVAALTLVFTLNLGSGYTQRIDHRMFKLESSLNDNLVETVCTELCLETERRFKSRKQTFYKS